MTISPQLVEVQDCYTDDELAVLAMAADPELALGDDAVSFWEVVGAGDEQLLPTWYMPSPRAGTLRLTGWRRRLVLLVIIAFVLIDAAGLCSTYGSIVIA